MEKEITIPKCWLENLLKYAERTEKLLGENHEIKVKYGLAEMLGYISSAKTILKRNQNDK